MLESSTAVLSNGVLHPPVGELSTVVLLRDLLVITSLRHSRRDATGGLTGLGDLITQVLISNKLLALLLSPRTLVSPSASRHMVILTLNTGANANAVVSRMCES